MSNEIEVSFSKQYSTNVELLFQQEKTGLRPAVRTETLKGESGFFDYIGEVSGEWPDDRHGNSPQMDTPHSRRKVTSAMWDWGDFVDDYDQVRMLIDPKSAYARAAAAAANRAYDEKILAAMGGIAYAGKEGTEAINNYAIGECRLIDGQGTVVAAGSDHSNSTATGITLAKIAQCGQLMDDMSVPATDRYFVCNTNQKWYLLGSTKATSADYNGIRALVHGDINSYLNFNFIWLPSDRFSVEALNTTNVAIDCYAFHKSCILLGIWGDYTNEITKRADKRYSTYLYSKMFIGATRLQGKGVVEIVLLKDPTIDFSQD
jgi:hypothetical protein